MSADLASDTKEVTKVFVRLKDELVNVSRPVKAEKIRFMIYRILEEGFDPEIESWEFQPGETVRVELRHDVEGEYLMAVAKIVMV